MFSFKVVLVGIPSNLFCVKKHFQSSIELPYNRTERKRNIRKKNKKKKEEWNDGTQSE